MAPLSGHTGAFYKSTGSLTTVTGETPSGTINGSNVTFTTANGNVLPRHPPASADGFQVNSDGAGLSSNGFTVTPGGTITMSVAPASTLVVNYKYYGTVQEAGGFTGWTLTRTAELLEHTEFQSAGNREYTVGLKMFEVSAEQWWQNQDEAHADRFESKVGDLVVLKLYTHEGNSERYEAWAYVSSIAPNVAVDPLISSPLTFMGTELLQNST